MEMDHDSAKLAKEIERSLLLPLRLRWLGNLTSAAAFAVSCWLIWVAYGARGFVAAVVTFVLLSLCYGFGPAPMLAVAASILCFYFHAVGIWLPIASYISAAVLLYASIRLQRVRKMVNPF